MVKFEAVLHTEGSGYWSDAAAAVKTTKLTIPYIDDEEEFGELRIYFDTKTWDCNELGLIYTDGLFIQELRATLVAAGISSAAADDIDYSEQGMQGNNYVSCDVGEAFLKEWPLLSDALYKMVKKHKVVDTAAA